MDMDRFRESLTLFLMKFRVKLRFHGPALSSIHHFTAFIELDSIIICEGSKRLHPSVSFFTRWIACTSAMLISMSGMGNENTQTKFPRWSLRTPPIAAWWHEGWKNASTFHFMTWMGGGLHITRFFAHCGLDNMLHFSAHAKQDGLLIMSWAEYGKGSPHPFIHQLILMSIKSCRWAREEEMLSKILKFLSFQIVHTFKLNYY